ncbi:MAG: response regulator transcription factor [Lachnospiraceae bacterium]|nr:response regulator transcription factor [Lachnospiraceae bacterium]
MEFTGMIIDDEKIVREGICDLIDWNAEGYRLVPGGKDGREGLAGILRYQPDLVLVDIKMPGITGLELIQEARKQGFQGHFIILTGYSEFEYAKTAISMGVEGYLLKPVDEDELLGYVRRIRKKLEQEVYLKSYHSRNEDKARQELLRRIVLNEDSPENLKRDIELYQLPMEGSCLCVAVCRDKDEDGDKEEKHFQEKLAALIEGDAACMGTFSIAGGAVLVGKGITYKQWKSRIEKRNRRLASYYGSGFRLAIGNNVHSWKELFCSYESALYLLDQSFIFGEEDILTIDLICNLEESREAVSVEYLEMLIEVGEAEGIRRAMGMFRDYCAWHMLKSQEIKILLIQELLRLQMKLGKKYNSEALSDEKLQPLIRRLMEAENMTRLLECFEGVLTSLSQEIGTGGAGNIIRRVYYYMEKNYDKDLKLETIARNFNYNSAYLGKLFRKETGESFNNSLDIIRINNARRLLQETNLKVYQISERVGYGSIDYFYIKFKKYVGISPKEYRKNLKDEE